MNEYVLIEKQELAQIADKVRSLSGSTETMNVLEIDNKLDSANSTIDNAVAAVISALAEKGIEVPSDTNVTGLAELIASIESGGGRVFVTDIVPATNISTCSDTLLVEHGLDEFPDYILVAQMYRWNSYGTRITKQIACSAIIKTEDKYDDGYGRIHNHYDTIMVYFTANDSNSVSASFETGALTISNPIKVSFSNCCSPVEQVTKTNFELVGCVNNSSYFLQAGSTYKIIAGVFE